MRLAAILITLAVALSGCVQQNRSTNSYGDYMLRENLRRNALIKETSAALVTAKAGQIPGDYRARISSGFNVILKDPESKRLEWSAPVGSIACGRVNAKNSYGGYTGAKPFGAMFFQDGSMKGPWIFDDIGLLDYAPADEGAAAVTCGVIRQ